MGLTAGPVNMLPATHAFRDTGSAVWKPRYRRRALRERGVLRELCVPGSHGASSRGLYGRLRNRPGRLLLVCARQAGFWW
jgi:hypothetical protein